MNEIIYRKNSITNADIVTGNCLLSHAMTGDTLAADTLDFRVWSDTGLGKVDADFFTADEKTITTQDGKVFRCFVRKDLTDFVAGDSVEYKRDEKMVGKFYLRNVKRSYKFYDFTCISAIGILGDTLHYGGIYTGETVAEVAAGILEGLPYEIDPIVSDIKLYGWLPIDTKRNNLQQITIATAIAVRTKSDGTLYLTVLSNDTKGTIGASRMAIGGSVAVDTPYSAVQVSEHYYQEIAEEIVLFSESSVKTEFLKFTEPVHDLTVTGGTLIEWGANYAIVECSGYTEVKAKRYLHTTRAVTVGTIEGLPSDKIYSVNNATLITSLNSSGVAQKLYEAYTQPKTIQANIFYGDEKSGDIVKAYNPYSEQLEDAFLKRQDINISNLLLANSDFIVDFTPSGAITGYQNRVLITEGTSWTKPAGVTDYRAILIGAGDGAQAGLNGANGDNGVRYIGTASTDRGDGGEGGNGGLAGNPGKIFDTGSITVDTAEQTISLTIGAAGTGGASNGASGTTGGETTLDTYTSADGQTKESGYVDILQGDIFALPAKNGIDGGKGQGDIPTTSEQVTGHDDTIYYGGVAGATETEGSSSNRIGAAGGGGGGAAVGDSNPADTLKDGTDGYIEGTTPYGGDGGRGGNADAGLDATVYGGAGNGGHGGGGGGGGGCTLRPTTGGVVGTGGPGGTGGAGGDGKQGCIIIYY